MSYKNINEENSQYKIYSHTVFDTARVYLGEKSFDIVECCDELNRLNEENKQLHEEKEEYKSYINTLGIGISKIMQSIKEDKEDKALIMCFTLLKKLEEEELLE